MKPIYHKDIICKVMFTDPDEFTSSPHIGSPTIGNIGLLTSYITPCPVCRREIRVGDSVRMAHDECWRRLNFDQRTYLTSLLHRTLSRKKNRNIITRLMRRRTIFVTYSSEALWKLESRRR